MRWAVFTAWVGADVGGWGDHVRMAEIDIRELRAFEPFCLHCGESGPIETNEFLAFAWQQAHSCAELAEARFGERIAS